MKRIVLILALVFSFGMTVAHAEITQGSDKFTGGKSYYSRYNFKVDEGICLTKIIDKNSTIYEITLSAKTLSNDRFSKMPIEIKTDDKPIQKLEVKEASFLLLDPYKPNGVCHIWSEAVISQDVIENMKIAKRVAIRAYKNQGLEVVVVLPTSVLTEWQQVINTEK